MVAGVDWNNVLRNVTIRYWNVSNTVRLHPISIHHFLLYSVNVNVTSHYLTALLAVQLEIIFS